MKWYILFSCLYCSVYCYSENVVWSGNVNSDGTPTQAIKLVRLKEYQIRVSKEVNLGKWVKQGEPLNNDACYQYNASGTILDKLETLKNSASISVCEGQYHTNHVYLSAPFKAEQDRIHFWVHDLTYDDNEGDFKVEILEAVQ